MEIANLILEYLKVIIDWPMLVLALGWIFKDPVSDLLRKIKKIGFAGGSLDAEADEASSEVDEVRIAAPRTAEPIEAAATSTEPSEQPQGHLPDHSESAITSANEPAGDPRDESTEGGIEAEHDAEAAVDMRALRFEREMVQRRKNVDEGQHYESYRQLALASPGEAMREAYQRVRLSGRRLLQDVQSRPGIGLKTLLEIVDALAQQGLISPDAAEPARRLDRIYHLAANSRELSAKGALSFVDAAQKLDSLIAETRAQVLQERRTILRRVRPVVEEMLDTYGFAKTDARVLSLTGGIIVRFAGTRPDPDSDPRYSALVVALRDLAKREGVSIRIRHDDGVRTFA